MSKGLREHTMSLRMAKAIAFYRRNPQATIAEVAAACEVSPRLVFAARKQMVIEGVCKPNRRSPVPNKPAEGTEPPPPAPPPANTMLDGEQMSLLAEGDTSDFEDADPETRKKMLRELRNIAFGANHPDTRVTAMKAWFTLKDMATAKDLGPGAPMTEEAAIERLSAIHEATGIMVAVKAIIRAFSLSRLLHAIESLFRKESSDGEAASDAGDADSGPAGPVDAPGHPGGEAEVEGVRTEHVDQGEGA